jgi:hypothetical protein
MFLLRVYCNRDLLQGTDLLNPMGWLSSQNSADWEEGKNTAVYTDMSPTCCPGRISSLQGSLSPAFRTLQWTDSDPAE